MTKYSILLTIIIVGLLSSCKKKDTESVLGLDIQPENDLLGITISDSSSIFMHTQLVDSVKSYNDQYKYLGSTQDPIFGSTEAKIYTNFSISNNLTNVSFGINPVLDSAELVIRYLRNYSGDTATVLNYSVYQLTNSIGTSSNTYYSNDDVNHSNYPVNINNGKHLVRDGAYYLVMKLDPMMCQSILETEANLTNNIAFQNANKGFLITATNPSGVPSSGAIRKYDLDDDNSGIKLYYHNGNSTSSKGQTFLFTFRGVDAVRFNNIKHNYSSGASSNLFDQITGAGTADTLKGNQNVYLQSFGGTRVRVYLPFLKSFSDSVNVSINRAELIIKVDETGYNANYGYPANLALLACNSSGTEELVFDQLETTDFIKYNGNYDATKKQYVFNIARQMQKIITNKITNYGFYLVNATPSRATVIRRDNRLERVILGGINNTAYKPTFKVTYIKFNYDK